MTIASRLTILMYSCFLAGAGCSEGSMESPAGLPQPQEIIDLGALVTEDLPERVWGRGYLDARGYTRPNSFDVIEWNSDGIFSGSNAYYTLFNHGGPHVDAPNHMGFDGGVDSYPVEAFAGPLKVVDVSGFEIGFTVPREIFATADIRPGDVVVIVTRYAPPNRETGFPETIALTWDAAEYLAELPIRAFGTDAWSVDNLQDDPPSNAPNEHARKVPVHYSFLSRGIPVYEQLFNVARLLGRDDMYFVGVPLNIQGGDGMMVRPVALIY